MATFPIVDLSADTDIDMVQVARLAATLGYANTTGTLDPNDVISTAVARLADAWHDTSADDTISEEYFAAGGAYSLATDPDARLRAATYALVRSLGWDDTVSQHPIDVMWGAAARLDASPIIPGELAADLPYGSLIVRCDERGAPLELMIVRVGEPGYAVRMGAEDTRYRVLYRPIEVPPQPGEAVRGERARRLPEGSIVVPATLTDDESAEVPETDAPVHQRHSDGVWYPTTPAGSRYIVLHVGVR